MFGCRNRVELRRDSFEVSVLAKFSLFVIVKALDFGLQKHFRWTKWIFFRYKIVSVSCF